MEESAWNDLIQNDEGTKQARRVLGAEIILDLDTTISMDQYEGTSSQELVRAMATFGEINNEAWKLAFMSYLEAAMVALDLGVYENLDAVVDLIRWCRRAVGLSEELATAQREGFAIVNAYGREEKNT